MATSGATAPVYGYKFQIGDSIKFSLSSMKRVVNKVLPLTSTDPNLLDIPGGPQLQVFRHTFQNRTRRYFFWVTTQVGLRPSLPSQMHSTAWEEDCAVTRLLAGNHEQPLSLSMLVEEPGSKRQKKGMIIAGNVASTEQQIALEATRQFNDDRLPAAVPLSSIVDSGHHDGDWWKSGDARRLFAPSHSCSGSKYDSRSCSVKEVVMDRIETFECVNRAASNWNFVVDTSAGDQSLKYYSEADVFSLRFRSMYLAIALKQFVLNVIGNMKTQWTWKQCLQFAIKNAMNDVLAQCRHLFELFNPGTLAQEVCTQSILLQNKNLN